jgi:NAD(P)-dependent dehydrogenase (short-subunit alcohol dehydrogenase family)
MISFERRVAIVTGAGGGLGRAYALALAERGARVLVNDLGSSVAGSGSDSSVAQAVVDEIVGAGGEAVANSDTVATAAGGEAIVDHAVRSFGRVDVLINNAGTMRLSSLAKLDVTTIGELLDVHLGAAFYVTQPAYRRMIEQRYGRIVFTVSSIGAFGIYGAGLYGAAKGGIVGLMNCLELEARRHDIRVNAIAPMAETRMSAEGMYDAVPEASRGPELVAPVATYLASEECESHGQVWSAGAGSVAEFFTARTQGFFKHPETEGRLTAEDVAHNVGVIRERVGLTEPDDCLEEWNDVAEMYNRRA